MGRRKAWRDQVWMTAGLLTWVVACASEPAASTDTTTAAPEPTSPAVTPASGDPTTSPTQGTTTPPPPSVTPNPPVTPNPTTPAVTPSASDESAAPTGGTDTPIALSSEASGDGSSAPNVTTTDASGEDTNAAAPCDASKAPVVGGLGLKTVITSPDLSTVSYAIQPPDSDDWYLVEQRGRIRILRDGALLATPFYDVSSEISLNAMYDEQGLHSIAFPPDYATSGKFFVVLTPNVGDRAHRDLLLEHQRSAENPDVADQTVLREFLNLEGRDTTGLFDNLHNAYMARFGPDGMLYVGMGDGGGECNNNEGFQDLPQDVNSPMGKILRFDPSRPAPYGAADNPFVGVGDERVYHYGVRNPFRFSWDSATGNFFFGDVGQDTHEELNVAPAGSVGLNFGWANYEGNSQTCTGRSLHTGATAIPPIFATDHGGGTGLAPACQTSPFCDYSSMVGGAVYHGTALPQLRGMFIFGDWAGDNMAALYYCDGETSEVTPIDYVPDPNVPTNGYLLAADDDVPELKNITTIIEGHDGELYMTVNGNSLVQIVPAP